MKKNTTIVAVSLIAIAIAGVMLLGRSIDGARPSQAEVATRSALSALELSYDFGVLSMRDGNIVHNFKVTNATDKDLTIERLSTSCMCTTAYIVDNTSRTGPFGMAGMGYGTKTNKVFKAGESKDIEVLFDPNAHGPAGIGPMQRVIQLTDSTGGVLQLQITGLVKP